MEGSTVLKELESFPLVLRGIIFNYAISIDGIPLKNHWNIYAWMSLEGRLYDREIGQDEVAMYKQLIEPSSHGFYINGIGSLFGFDINDRYAFLVDSEEHGLCVLNRKSGCVVSYNFCPCDSMMVVQNELLLGHHNGGIDIMKETPEGQFEIAMNFGKDSIKGNTLSVVVTNNEYYVLDSEGNVSIFHKQHLNEGKSNTSRQMYRQWSKKFSAVSMLVAPLEFRNYNFQVVLILNAIICRVEVCDLEGKLIEFIPIPSMPPESETFTPNSFALYHDEIFVSGSNLSGSCVMVLGCNGFHQIIHSRSYMPMNDIGYTNKLIIDNGVLYRFSQYTQELEVFE